jgi:putative ABC transport system permease protein
LARPGTLHIRTQLGALHQVVEEALVVLAPDEPEGLDARVPRAPDELRRGVSSDTSGLVLVLGIVMLLVGGVGIANVTLASVLERVDEIGLRRALGATRCDILLQFLGESATVGTVGADRRQCRCRVGCVGVGCPSVDAGPGCADPASAVLLGLLVGLAAAAYPAAKAGRVEPIAALREG